MVNAEPIESRKQKLEMYVNYDSAAKYKLSSVCAVLDKFKESHPMYIVGLDNIIKELNAIINRLDVDIRQHSDELHKIESENTLNSAKQR